MIANSVSMLGPIVMSKDILGFAVGVNHPILATTKLEWLGDQCAVATGIKAHRLRMVKHSRHVLMLLQME